MKTINKCFAAIGVATLLAAPNLFAGITGTALVNYDYSTALINVATTPDAGTPDLGFFYTFCLNNGVTINTPANVRYTGGDSAIPGGPGVTMAPDPISIGTAWLYSQFRMGTLAGYANTATINHEIQQAIWWLEGDGGANNSWITLAETTLGLTDATIIGDAGINNYGVFALNLVTLDENGRPTQNYVQPVLGMVPEPSTVIAGALLLLPFGVSTLRILRKKQA